MICFIHIEKAAGITLHHIFKNNSLRYITLSPWSIWANDQENVFTAQEARIFFKLFPYLNGFGGHTTRVYLNYEQVLNREIAYFTFLREPVQRFLSQFFYHQQIMQIEWTLESFLENGYFNNFMTKRICGKDDPEKAMELLEKKFTFVGLVEYFDESLLLLQSALGLVDYKMNYTLKNKNPHKNKNLISDALQERIYLANAHDVELYGFVTRELYPKYKQNYGADLPQRLEAFRSAQEKFKFNPWKLAFHAIMRHGIYRHVEKVLHKKFH